MKHCLLRSFAAALIAFSFSTAALADNVVYGLLSSYSKGAQPTSVDLDKVNTNEVTTLTPSDFAYADAQEVKCGVTAGDKYFAFVTQMDPDTYDENNALVTINFTTGKTVVVNNFSYKYGKPGYNPSGMAYDSKSNTMYAIEVNLNDDNAYVTELYSVNQTDGQMTKVATLDGQYQAITSDNNGGFYLLQNYQDGASVYASLFKVAADFTVTPVVENKTVTSTWSASNSLIAAEDGKTVYLIAGKKVLAFDVDAKTVTLKGDLSDLLYAASYGKSTADGTEATPPAEEKKQTRFLIKKEFFGSSMGDISSDVVSSRSLYYYNTNGKVVGSITLGREYSEYGGVTDNFAPTSTYKYTFDENGNCTNMDSYQWGLYDFDEFAWQKTKNCESYEYDATGKLVKEDLGNRYYLYTYNEDGTLASKEEHAKSTDALLQKFTYVSYDENKNLLQYTSDGAYDSYKYQADITYDENGNKIEEYQYTVGEDPDFPGEPKYTGKQLETWTYDNDVLKTYEKSDFNAEGNAVPEFKTEYTLVDGNKDIVHANSYTYSNDKWSNSGLPQRNYYADFANMDEMTYTEIVASQVNPDLVNTVDLAFSVPQLAYTQDCKVVVYRDGLPIDTVGLFDVYDEESGMCIYQDKSLKNGTYTYFVQPLFSTSSEGPLSADGDNAEQVWTGYYSSSPINVTVHTDLPAVTDLKLAGGKVETTGSFVNIQKTYYANLAWKNPEDTEKYGFVKNSIYFDDAQVSELDTTDVNANNATVALYGYDVKAYVVTTYKFGHAISDTIDVKIKDIQSFATGVNAVTVDGTVKATFANNILTLGSNANVTVFAANGQKVCTKNNTNSVDLGQLAPATYIVCVEKNGKADAYKYRVK